VIRWLLLQQAAPRAFSDRIGSEKISSTLVCRASLPVNRSRLIGRCSKMSRYLLPGANRTASQKRAGPFSSAMAGWAWYLACPPVSMRFGFDGLAAQVAHVLDADPFSGHLFLFRSKRADYLKCLYWDGTGLCLFAKRLEAGRFVWPPIVDGGMVLTPAQLGLLVEAMDWQRMVAPPVSFHVLRTRNLRHLRPRRRAGRWRSDRGMTVTGVLSKNAVLRRPALVQSGHVLGERSSSDRPGRVADVRHWPAGGAGAQGDRDRGQRGGDLCQDAGYRETAATARRLESRWQGL